MANMTFACEAPALPTQSSMTGANEVPTPAPEIA
tara:strand:- start:122 stop:223 length:102 start_codon:yes stop_codon:yes gene_type:complete